MQAKGSRRELFVVLREGYGDGVSTEKRHPSLDDRSTRPFASSIARPPGRLSPRRSFIASRRHSAASRCARSTWARPPCRDSPPSPSSTFCSRSPRSSLGNVTSSRWSHWGTCSRRRRSHRTSTSSPGRPSVRARFTCTSARPEASMSFASRRPRLPACPRRGGGTLRGAEAPGGGTPIPRTGSPTWRARALTSLRLKRARSCGLASAAEPAGMPYPVASASHISAARHSAGPPVSDRHDERAHRHFLVVRQDRVGAGTDLAL